MEETPENGKELSHSAHTNGMNGQCLTVDTTITYKNYAFLGGSYYIVTSQRTVQET